MRFILALLAPLLHLHAAEAAAPGRVAGVGPTRRTSTVPVMRILELDGCRGKSHFFQMDKVQVFMDAHGSEYAVADGQYLKRMKYISKMVVPLTRCRGGVSPSLCEYFTTWTWTTAACDLVQAEGAIWSDMLKSYAPPFRCPNEPGPCHVGNVSVDMNALHAMMAPSGLYKYIWIGQLELYDEEGKLSVCINGTIEVRRVRRRL